MESIKEIIGLKENICKAAGKVKSKDINIFNKSEFRLKVELKSGKEYPETLEVDFGLLIDEIAQLKSARNLIDKIRAELERDLDALFESKTYDEFIDNFKDLTNIAALKELPDTVKGIINMELSLALSFVAAIKNFPQVDPGDYSESLKEYFFAKKGYETVSGDLIVRPKLPKASALAEGDVPANIRGIGNQIDAERYIRDITRIIVETTGDEIYDLRERYSGLKAKFNEEPKKKIVDWFDSFGDLAEALVLPVVEEILSGAGNIQLNPLLVAGIGTFCSVTVRKATEHAYLELLDL